MGTSSCERGMLGEVAGAVEESGGEIGQRRRTGQKGRIGGKGGKEGLSIIESVAGCGGRREAGASWEGKQEKNRSRACHENCWDGLVSKEGGEKPKESSWANWCLLGRAGKVGRGILQVSFPGTWHSAAERVHGTCSRYSVLELFVATVGCAASPLTVPPTHKKRAAAQLPASAPTGPHPPLLPRYVGT